MNKIILILGLLLGLISCNGNQQGSEGLHNVLSDSLVRNNSINDKLESRFKVWLKDTLVNLNSITQEQIKSLGISDRKISISLDSLELTIDYFYDMLVNPNKISTQKEINHMIELLKEYDELPNSNFQFKFQIQYAYSPSAVLDRAYTYDYEIKNIETFEQRTKIKAKYYYLKGRLTRKEIIYFNNGIEDKKNIDFNWDGNKLLKVPQKRKKE